MLSQEESGCVFAMLKSEQRPVEEIVSGFIPKFPRHRHFAICNTLSILLQVINSFFLCIYIFLSIYIL